MRGSGLVWRAMARARRSNLAVEGTPPARPGAGGISRRRLLGAMAASAALPTMGCTPLRSIAGTRVAIVGGGLAGLNALRLLADAGVDARLYEARGRLGGRVFTHHGGPVPADDGGQFVNSDHADMLELAKRYALRLIDRGQQQGRDLVVAGGRVLSEAELARDMRSIAARIAADATALDADYDAVAPALDALSVSQYLDRHADALPQPHVRHLLEATIRTEFGQEPAEASALELIFNLPVVDGRHVEIIGASDERFVIEGGSATLVAAMARSLADHVELGRVLTRIEGEGEGLRLHFDDGGTVEAERALVTVPAPLLCTIDFGGLVPPLWRQYAAEIGCGANEKLNAAYRGRPWETAMGRAGAIWPLPGGFAEAWDAGTTPSETGLLTWFMGGAQCAAAEALTGAELRARFEADAAPAIAGLGEAGGLWQRRTRWGRDRFSRGAYSCFRPGQLTRFASLFFVEEEGAAPQVPAFGPLTFAGEHLSDAWPGYMNGGAQTGRMAAEALLAGQERQAPH